MPHASLVVLAAGLQALHTTIGSIKKLIVVQRRPSEASKKEEAADSSMDVDWAQTRAIFGPGLLLCEFSL